MTDMTTMLKSRILGDFSCFKRILQIDPGNWVAPIKNIQNDVHHSESPPQVTTPLCISGGSHGWPWFYWFQLGSDPNRDVGPPVLWTSLLPKAPPCPRTDLRQNEGQPNPSQLAMIESWEKGCNRMPLLNRFRPGNCSIWGNHDIWWLFTYSAWRSLLALRRVLCT